ncbi:hypothetical protein P4O66_014106 [Electrophorus voltai]|uniref:Uncharacterized protein n=1 Tax=Electrophorus voltai TaxID=2609070 RepID=A0AAD9DR77_9TELE|nr:hypothetical protein P4O66_014106 [Electrophorus voltai]
MLAVGTDEETRTEAKDRGISRMTDTGRKYTIGTDTGMGKETPMPHGRVEPRPTSDTLITCLMLSPA